MFLFFKLILFINEPPLAPASVVTPTEWCFFNIFFVISFWISIKDNYMISVHLRCIPKVCMNRQFRQSCSNAVRWNANFGYSNSSLWQNVPFQWLQKWWFPLHDVWNIFSFDGEQLIEAPKTSPRYSPKVMWFCKSYSLIRILLSVSHDDTLSIGNEELLPYSSSFALSTKSDSRDKWQQISGILITHCSYQYNMCCDWLAIAIWFDHDTYVSNPARNLFISSPLFSELIHLFSDPRHDYI